MCLIYITRYPEVLFSVSRWRSLCCDKILNIFIFVIYSKNSKCFNFNKLCYTLLIFYLFCLYWCWTIDLNKEKILHSLFVLLFFFSFSDYMYMIILTKLFLLYDNDDYENFRKPPPPMHSKRLTLYQNIWVVLGNFIACYLYTFELKIIIRWNQTSGANTSSNSC